MGMACVSLALLCLLVPVYTGAETAEGKTPDDGSAWTDMWLVRLLLNMMGYATVFIPGALLIRYLKKNRYNETAGPGCMPNFLVLCFFGHEKDAGSLAEEGGGTGGQAKSAQKKMEEQPLAKRGMVLFICFLGLQTSYLTWGVLQERIMTYEYGKTDTTPGEYFKNSQFLVFINRILAFVIALLVIVFQPQPRHTAPLYKYSFSSLSNIMSSWFQYEALKFVSFPTQVLAKASKVIPTMLMGIVVSKKTYAFYEYLTAVMISVGVGLFLLTSQVTTRHGGGTVTTTSGLCLLVGYMLFDSFTSNWQGELFTQHKMSSIQMMAGTNLFSCLLTCASLLEQGGFLDSSAFMLRHPDFLLHAVVLSVCSATGQLFIFYTIAQFGPVTFVIIMTMRQGFAILLSCIIYSHPVTMIGLLGILIVFAALFIRIYASQRQKALRAAQAVRS
ncbi:adenosine 3'-phospho 5'-phosphosulfate transporter 1-like [Babylonia areolata]|uniref:adenosine 3'-phospho 5'-phosphosulfate transporter 1-like n=1 Tax=Babylonia areolata TaxID=304850 RepID=UPI003FD5D8A6